MWLECGLQPALVGAYSLLFFPLAYVLSSIFSYKFGSSRPFRFENMWLIIISSQD